MHRGAAESPPLPRSALAFRVTPRTDAVSVQRPVPPGTAGYVLRVYEPSSQMPDAAFSAMA